MTHCEYCEIRWPALDRKKLVQARDAHIPQCGETHNHQRRVVDYWDMEIMTEDQQEAFSRVKSIRDNERKFREMYKALGMPQPDTYRELQETPLLPPFPIHTGFGFDRALTLGMSAITFADVWPLLLTTPTFRSDSSFWRGFQPPMSATHAIMPSSQPHTYFQISSLANGGSSSQQQVPLIDSGYGSETRDKPPQVDAAGTTAATWLSSSYNQLDNESVFQHCLYTEHVDNYLNFPPDLDAENLDLGNQGADGEMFGYPTGHDDNMTSHLFIP